MKYFGDYRYGTEILMMPQPDEPFLPVHQEETKNEWIDQPCDFMPDETGEINSENQFWFRWITGHQMMFILWRQLTTAMQQTVHHMDDEYMDHCTQIMDGCSVIFEYTGFMPQDFYLENIRTFMALAHKGFSGFWAADYKYIPKLTRQLMQAKYAGKLAQAQKGFKESYMLGHKIHMAVAKKLVPGGDSLLKNAKKEGHNFTRAKEHHYMHYDFFFLVHRQLVTATQFKVSTEKRKQVIIEDLANNNLYNSSFDDPILILEKAVKSACNILNLESKQQINAL